MFEKVLQQMCRSVRAGKVIFTTHAYDEMNEDDLFVSDIIRTNELQVWFLSEHVVDVPLVRADGNK